MSSLPSLESIYGSLTADITANTAKLERLGNQNDAMAMEDEDEDSIEKSEFHHHKTLTVLSKCPYVICVLQIEITRYIRSLRNFESVGRHREG